MTANSFIQQGIFITEPHQEILQAHMAELGNDFLKSLGFSECQIPNRVSHIERTRKMEHTTALWHGYAATRTCIKPLLCPDCYLETKGDAPVTSSAGHERCAKDGTDCLNNGHSFYSASCIDDTCGRCRPPSSYEVRSPD